MDRADTKPRLPEPPTARGPALGPCRTMPATGPAIPESSTFAAAEPPALARASRPRHYRADGHAGQRPGGRRRGRWPDRPAASGRSFTALGARVPAAALAPGLHVVATPIGNLGDITLRALHDAGRRRRRAGRGHAGVARAARPLRHRRPAPALPRAQCRGDAPAGAGAARGRPGAGAGLGRRHAARVRPRLQAGARRRRGRGRRHGRARRLRRDGGPGAGRPADRPLLLRGLPAARSPARGARGWPSSRPCRARWCSSNRRAASPTRSPTSRPCSARARPRWRAS